MTDISRRSLLQSAAGVAAVAATGSTAAASEPVVPTTDDEIVAAFEGVPRIHDPSPKERKYSRIKYPDVVVPETGAVPDYHAGRTVVEMEAPKWALASVYDRLNGVEDVSPLAVGDHLLELCWAHEEYVVPGGGDAQDPVADVLSAE